MNQQQKINIDLTKCEDITCSNCKCPMFKPAFLLKKISALMSPTGQDAIIPMQVFICLGCGKAVGLDEKENKPLIQ
jgi:hypothetical protein